MCTMHVHFHPPRGSLSYFSVPCHCKQQCNEHLWICLLEFLGTVSLGFEHKCGLAGSLSRNFPRWTPPGFFSAERLFKHPTHISITGEDHFARIHIYICITQHSCFASLRNGSGTSFRFALLWILNISRLVQSWLLDLLSLSFLILRSGEDSLS